MEISVTIGVALDQFEYVHRKLSMSSCMLEVSSSSVGWGVFLEENPSPWKTHLVYPWTNPWQIKWSSTIFRQCQLRLKHFLQGQDITFSYEARSNALSRKILTPWIYSLVDLRRFIQLLSPKSIEYLSYITCAKH